MCGDLSTNLLDLDKLCPCLLKVEELAQAQGVTLSDFNCKTSLMPIEAALWVTEPAQRPMVDHVLASMYDPHTLTVFSASGAMYSHSVGTEEWEELRVPSGFPMTLVRGGTSRLQMTAGRQGCIFK